MFRRAKPDWQWTVHRGVRATPLWKPIARLSERVGLRQRRERQIVDRFHRLYYYDLIWRQTRWLGSQAMKPPTDLWTYQEIVFDTRPDVIIETGTARGGTAYFLACVCEQLGRGRVVTVGLDPVDPPAGGKLRDVLGEYDLPKHPRLTYIGGASSTNIDPAALGLDGRAMVILDSNHSYGHVTAELALYGPLVAAGCYLVVEDTNLGGHPVQPGFGAGPAEAVRDFLRSHPEFEVDESRARHLLTFHPGGYLRRCDV
jgi:cephalosporin hydroxylase